MLNLEEMKLEYINKTFNKLRVIDVFRSSNKAILFKCKCECGTICEKDFRKVISGHTKTCGSHIHRLERAKKLSQMYKDNPEIGKLAGKKISQWYKDNPDKVIERSENHKKWWDSHSEQRDYQSTVMSNRMCEKFYDSRVTADYSSLLEILHPKYMSDLLSGNIVSNTIIETRCPSCGNYGAHRFHDIFILSSSKLKYDHALLCDKCQREKTSRFELEIADFISTFYTGVCIRNDRSILNGKELDLYYPEKKIAIEYNGTYWHSDKFKDSGYHYNKFKSCYDLGIMLVSIFEFDFVLLKDSILSYIHDLFYGVENQLSFVSEDIINLNYPIPNLDLSMYIIKDNSYEDN